MLIRPCDACMQGPHHELPPDAPPSHSYGSRKKDEAVQKLQALGAKVYPPEAKDVMDWGILAGGAPAAALGAVGLL